MKPRLVLVGGFLGAGKTTLLLRAAELLTARGVRVGLVMNDQGGGLVDTALARAQAAPVVEVAGGCFCCRFPDLVEGLRLLRQTVAPQVILAEPVGSCTDLMATVLRRSYQGSGHSGDRPLEGRLDAEGRAPFLGCCRAGRVSATGRVYAQRARPHDL